MIIHGPNFRLNSNRLPAKLELFGREIIVPRKSKPEHPALDQLAARVNQLDGEIMNGQPSSVHRLLLSVSFAELLIAEGSIPLEDIRNIRSWGEYLQIRLRKLVQCSIATRELPILIGNPPTRGFSFVNSSGKRYRPRSS